MDEIKALLPQGFTLYSMPIACCSYSADVHAGAAIDTEYLAAVLKKLPAMKDAQANIVHLTIDPKAFNRN